MTADVEKEEVFMFTFNLLLNPVHPQFFRAKWLYEPLMTPRGKGDEA